MRAAKGGWPGRALGVVNLSVLPLPFARGSGSYLPLPLLTNGLDCSKMERTNPSMGGGVCGGEEAERCGGKRCPAKGRPAALCFPTAADGRSVRAGERRRLPEARPRGARGPQG